MTDLVVRNARLADLPTAWAMASTRPARFLGLPASAGLTIGAPADLVLFTWDGTNITIERTYKAGQLVYDRTA